MNSVIVIDDNEDMAALISEMFANSGLTSFYALSGTDALEKLRRQKESGETVTVCILDVVLSGLSGTELMQEIKNIFPQIRFILITGYTDIPDIQAMLDHGAMEIIYKPFKIDEIISKVKFIVSNTQRIPVS